MTIIDRSDEFQSQQEANAQIRQRAQGDGLAHAGGDAQGPGMQAELAVLKQRADHADQRMARVEDKLDRITEQLGTLATRTDVEEGSRRAVSAAWNALGVGGTIAVGIVALFVAVLAYLQDQRISTRPEPPQAAAPAPIILQLPPWPSAPSPAAPTPATPSPG